MADLTSRQLAEFAALRQASSEQDYEMVAASFEILQSLETPLLPLLEALGHDIWDDEEDPVFLALIDDLFQSLDEQASPALATYLMEEEGPDLLLDLAAARLEMFDEAELLPMLKAALRHPDERIREGVRDYLDEMAVDSDGAELILDEIEDFE